MLVAHILSSFYCLHETAKLEHMSAEIWQKQLENVKLGWRISIGKREKNKENDEIKVLFIQHYWHAVLPRNCSIVPRGFSLLPILYYYISNCFLVFFLFVTQLLFNLCIFFGYLLYPFNIISSQADKKNLQVG